MSTCRNCNWYEPDEGDNNSDWGYCSLIHDDVKWNDTPEDHGCKYAENND